MEIERRPIGPGPSDVDLSGFGLDPDDDTWLHLACEAEREPPPGRLGAYDVLEEIGRGGQGVVYRAREPGTDRVVALKRCTGGRWATDRVRSRFELEALTELALRHPNIVGVIGVQTAEEGPLLAMEWVDGLPTDRWAAQGTGGRRPLPEILRAFVKVCDAVHFAHQRGVIHRDLKPSNILIDTTGEPRVLDFGLARLVGPDGGAEGPSTGVGFVGTPAYAAPEQILGPAHELDTRTDVYALGVVLFQMLTGRLPFEGASDLGGLVDAARTAEPDRPSRVAQGLNADVDAIVARAMAREAARRYASADALAEDVRRCLSGDAVDARRGARGYVLRKTLVRYRVPATIAAAFVLLLTAGLVGSVSMWRHAERQRVLAQRQQARAEEVTALVGRIFRAADPHSTRPRDATARDLLDEFSRTLVSPGTLDPAIESSLREIVGWAYLGLGDPERAAPHLERMLALARANPADGAALGVALGNWARLLHDRGEYDAAYRTSHEGLAALESALGPDHPEVGESLGQVGELARHVNRHDEAVAFYRRAVDIYRRDGNDPDGLCISLTGLGDSLSEAGAADEADRALEEARAVVEAAHGKDCLGLAAVLSAQSGVFRRGGRFGPAEAASRDALHIRLQLLGPDHPEVADVLAGLGVTLWRTSRPAEARDLFAEALRIYRAAIGPEHPKIAQTLHNLGAQAESLNEWDEAARLYEEALAMRRELLGEAHPDVGGSLNNLATLRWRQGRLGDAASLLEQALAIHESAHPQNQTAVALALSNLGTIRQEMGDAAEAEALYTRALAALRAIHGDAHPDVAVNLSKLGDVQRATGRHEESVRSQSEAARIARLIYGDRHLEVALVLTRLSHATREGGDPTQGEAVARQALDAVAPGDSPRVIESRGAASRALGMALADQGRHGEAIEPLRASLADLRASLRAAHPEVGNALTILGLSLVRHGDFVAAEPVLRECLEHRERYLPAGHWRLYVAMGLLGSAIAGQGRFEEAEPLVVDGWEGVRADPAAPAIRKREALDRAVALYEAWSRDDRASEYRALRESPGTERP